MGCGGVRFFDPIPGKTGEIVIKEGYRRVAGTSSDIVRMYVHPDGRRKGIASAIMEEIILACHQRGPIEIWSDKSFVDAHRLYAKFGAINVGERICNDPDQAPEWGMILDPNK